MPMKFFRHADQVVVPADHPAVVLVVDPHGEEKADGEHAPRRALEDAADAPAACGTASATTSQEPDDSPPSSPCPADDGPSSPTDPSPSTGAPKPKRALHLAHPDPDCPVANPDPHSRPRSRQFFRLGRNRAKAAAAPAYASTSDSSDDECHAPQGSPKPAARRRLALRKPGLRRAQSLPVEGTHASSSRDKDGPSTPVIEATGSADDAFDANDRGARDDRLVQSERGPRPRGHRRTVTFACVQIREYSTVLGDHPCCPSGPPLSLGWELKRENSMELESYEMERLPNRKKNKEEIKLSDSVRRDILQGLVAPAAGGQSEEGSDSDGASASEGERPCPMYSQRELRRAERKLTRERAGLNSRAHRRAHRGFFRPPTAEEERAAAGSPMRGVEACEGAEEGCGCGMDVSPVKPREGNNAAMDDGAES